MDQLAAALAQEEQLSPEQARTHLSSPDFALPAQDTKPAFHEALTAMRVAVGRILYALAKQPKGKEAEALLILGDLPNGLKEQLSSSLNKPLLALNPPPGFGMEEKQLEKFALCIGEALAAQPGNQQQIDFRQKEFQYPDRWKRLKKPLALYLLLCCGIAAALTLYGKAEIAYEKGTVRKHYLELLQVMNKPYAAFEKQYAAKFQPEKESGGEAPDPASLSMEEIQIRLAFLDKELQATPQIYPLQPNTPLVSDLLAWIAAHPSFQAKEGTPGLQIESLTYSMVKRPEPTKKQEKYQVKVELEFSSQIPKMAREFHDALIAPNAIVDPKGEIKWSSSRDRYRTSFFLKDKTVYPTLK